MNDDIDTVTTSATTLRERLGARTPRIAVLLGSGWGPFVDEVQDAVDVPYRDLPAFPSLGQGVSGHVGLLRAGRIGRTEVIVLAGRQHAYETPEPDGMNGAIRTLAAIGVRVLVQTNAAGSMEPALPPGSLMLLNDHLNVVQRTPLGRETGDDRFVDMSQAYCPRLRAQAQSAASALGTPLTEGVYAWVLGPQFETPAEIRMLRVLGAQAVGMSTVPETIVARHAGLRVLAFSLITNMASGMAAETLSHAHTLATARAASEHAVRTLSAVVQALET